MVTAADECRCDQVMGMLKEKRMVKREEKGGEGGMAIGKEEREGTNEDGETCPGWATAFSEASTPA